MRVWDTGTHKVIKIRSNGHIRSFSLWFERRNIFTNKSYFHYSLLHRWMCSDKSSHFTSQHNKRIKVHILQHNLIQFIFANHADESSPLLSRPIGLLKAKTKSKNIYKPVCIYILLNRTACLHLISLVGYYYFNLRLLATLISGPTLYVAIGYNLESCFSVKRQGCSKSTHRIFI